MPLLRDFRAACNQTWVLSLEMPAAPRDPRRCHQGGGPGALSGQGQRPQPGEPLTMLAALLRYAIGAALWTGVACAHAEPAAELKVLATDPAPDALLARQQPFYVRFAVTGAAPAAVTVSAWFQGKIVIDDGGTGAPAMVPAGRHRCRQPLLLERAAHAHRRAAPARHRCAQRRENQRLRSAGSTHVARRRSAAARARRVGKRMAASRRRTTVDGDRGHQRSRMGRACGGGPAACGRTPLVAPPARGTR